MELSQEPRGVSILLHSGLSPCPSTPPWVPGCQRLLLPNSGLLAHCLPFVWFCLLAHLLPLSSALAFGKEPFPLICLPFSHWQTWRTRWGQGPTALELWEAVGGHEYP